MSSYYQVSNDKIVESLEPIIETEGFLLPDKERYLAALRLFKGGVKHFGDACACTVALQDCGSRLYSFDTGLSNIQGLSRLECI